MNVKISVLKDNTKKLERALASLVQHDVLVGIPEDNTSRKEPGEPTNATIGYTHDKGSPSQNIPARPFMEPGIQRGKDEITNKMKQTAQTALKGSQKGVIDGLISVGLIAQKFIRARISEGIPPPLKPKTLAARRRRGRTGTIPLVDTGQLRNAINFILRKKSASD